MKISTWSERCKDGSERAFLVGSNPKVREKKEVVAVMSREEEIKAARAMKDSHRIIINDDGTYKIVECPT